MGEWITVSKSKSSFLRALEYCDLKRRMANSLRLYRSVLDFNPINTIASHMSYWADEDVCHFILSQMLVSNRTKTPRV